MEKVIYSLKNVFEKINVFFHSTEFLKVFDKVVKIAKQVFFKILIYFTLIAFCYVFMYPLLKVIVDSIKTEEDIVNPDITWIPTTFTFMNYKNAISALWISRTDANGGWMSSLLNSTVYSLLTALLETFVSCLAGYAFARFNFKGKKFWFAGLILGFILPTQLLTLPRSMILQPLMNKTASASQILGIATNAKIDGLLSVLTTIPIILLTALGQGINSSILIFIFFSFFKMIPQSLDEAAQIDGANFLQIFWHIIIKMSKASIMVVFLFAFIWNWNDIYSLNHLSALDEKGNGFYSLPQTLNMFNVTLSQGAAKSGVKDDSNNGGLKSAAIVFSILPLLVLYAFTQKQFVEGIENTGVTGV